MKTPKLKELNIKFLFFFAILLESCEMLCRFCIVKNSIKLSTFLGVVEAVVVVALVVVVLFNLSFEIFQKDSQ